MRPGKWPARTAYYSHNMKTARPIRWADCKSQPNHHAQKAEIFCFFLGSADIGDRRLNNGNISGGKSDNDSR